MYLVDVMVSNLFDGHYGIPLMTRMLLFHSVWCIFLMLRVAFQ